MPTVAEITVDLAAEHDDLDTIVAGLAPEDWARPTPSPRWDVADQIGHLRYFDLAATRAIVDPDGFTADLEESLARLGDEGTDFALVETRAMSPPELLAAWRDGRRQLLGAAATLSEDSRMVWYGPPMSGQSFLTARLMETWAHGQDICDTVGARRVPTDRLRHIAHLGVITRRFSYVVRGAEPPEGDVRVELDGPGGDVWTWNGDAAPDTIRGPAVDFCLVVTQRRHVDDTDLDVRGELARGWMGVAQAFAGGPSDGRRAGEYR